MTSGHPQNYTTLTDVTADFGEIHDLFPFPQTPLINEGDLKRYLLAHDDLAACAVIPSKSQLSQSVQILFDVDLDFGERGWLNVKSVALPGHCSALLVTDISKAKEIERSLQYAQKMEVVATFTSGIAHDFNNILAIITANLELIQHYSNKPDEVQRNSEKALHAARRAAAVVTSLLSFSKRKPERVSAVRVSQLLDEVTTIAGTSLGARYRLTCDIASDAVVMLDVAILESSLINLIVNARDAMPEGGEIQLASRLATRQELARYNMTADRPHVIISVIDQGVGLSPDLKSEITKSFFTTKSYGTGLGLAMIEGFVSGNGGHLVFDNNPAAGMTFSLILPCQVVSRPASIPAASPQGSNQETSPQHRTVMLIEDEIVLLDVTARLFNVSGYHCIKCTCLADIRDHLQRGGPLPDIIVTDLNLPDGNGQQLIGDDFPEFKGIPKILLSGNMETGGQSVIENGFDEICLKPIEITTLVSLVRKLTPPGVHSLHSTVG